MKKPTLAATAAAVTKRILGAELAKPATVQMPQAVAEIHVSPDAVIPGGTIITDEIAAEAGLGDEELAALEEGGHIKLVDVFAAPSAEG